MSRLISSGGFRQAADHTGERIMDGVRTGMQLVRGQAARNVRDNDSIASGQGWRSLQGRAERHGPEIHGLIYMEKYMIYVELGVTAAQRHGKMPPIISAGGGGILAWVRAKGIAPAVVKAKAAAEAAGKTLRLKRGLFTRAAKLSEAQAERALNGPSVQVQNAAALRLHLAGVTVLSHTVPRPKLSEVERSELSMAWGIAKHIAKHGQKAHPFLAPAVAELWPRIVKLVTSAAGSGR